MKKELLQQLSKQKNITLTTLREDVLTILYTNDEPLGAYDILTLLKKKRPNAEPPTVYRVLKFLVDNELIHRIDSKNTYVCCAHLTEKEATHKAILLLCSICKKSFEFTDKDFFQSIFKFAKKHSLKIDSNVFEMKGICSECTLAA